MRDFSVARVQLGEGIALLHVSGFLDAHTFEELDEAITGLFSESVYKVIVDLAEVEYISSAGAGVFIGAISESKENGGNIVIMNPGKNVSDVFHLLGITEMFDVVENKDAALAIF